MKQVLSALSLLTFVCLLPAYPVMGQSPSPDQNANQAARPPSGDFEDMPPALGDPEMIDMNFIVEFMRPGAPGPAYMADTEKVVSQALADGTHINHRTSGRVARDSQGRTWRMTAASEEAGAGGVVAKPESIIILDISGHALYTLMPEAKMAIKMVLPDAIEIQKQASDKMREALTKPRAQSNQPTASPAPPSKEVVASNPFFGKDTRTEFLGEQNIEGVIAQGKRYVATIPAGTIGNDRPIEVMAERWYSKELHTVVKMSINDPRKGEGVFRLMNIQLDEPPASLFEIPADYTIQEMRIPFGAFGKASDKQAEKPPGALPEKP